MVAVEVEAAAGSEPRPATLADEQWVYSLCKKRYSHKFNEEGTANWMRNWVLKRPDLYHHCRTQNAFCISYLSKRPWAPTEIECSVMMVCADEKPTALWEALSCLRASIEWGRRMKATTWKLMSDTEYDLAPVARYLGVKEISPRYVLYYDERNPCSTGTS
jgi:hypothetical protein